MGEQFRLPPEGASCSPAEAAAFPSCPQFRISPLQLFLQRCREQPVGAQLASPHWPGVGGMGDATTFPVPSTLRALGRDGAGGLAGALLEGEELGKYIEGQGRYMAGAL